VHENGIFAARVLPEVAVKATQITGLAAGREYLRFFFTPVGCSGPAFATRVLKISLAMILQRFRFTVVPGTRINRIVSISMNPRHGLPMIIVKKVRNYSINEVRGHIREMVNFPSNGSG
jgi:cytochrome P450